VREIAWLIVVAFIVVVIAGCPPATTDTTGQGVTITGGTDGGDGTDPTPTPTPDPTQPADGDDPVARAGPDQLLSDEDNDGQETVTLFGSGSFDGDGEIIASLWTEDGIVVAKGLEPDVALEVGTHDIVLTVTDNDGRSGADMVTVVIGGKNQAPLAVAGADQIVQDNDGDGQEAVTLDGSRSSDPNGTISIFQWLEGQVEIATGSQPTIAALNLGSHDITLLVTDDEGITGTDTVTVVVNGRPTADAGPNVQVGERVLIALEGNNSSDPNNDELNFQWTVTSGSVVLQNADTPRALFETPLVESATPVDIEFQLTVDDGNGASDTDTVVVSVIDSGSTEQVFVVTTGSRPRDWSRRPFVISGNGQFVAFESHAENLVPGDTNNTSDIFVVDRLAGTIERVSVASDGTQGDGASREPSISEDGDVVAFKSFATTLDPINDVVNGAGETVFVHIRSTGATRAVSRDTGQDVSGVAADIITESTEPLVSFRGDVVFYTSLDLYTTPGDPPCTNPPLTFAFSRVFEANILDLTNVRVRPVSTVILDSVCREPRFAFQGSPSDDGRFASYLLETNALDDNGGELMVVFADLQGVHTLLPETAAAWHSRMSPDSNYVAFSSDSDTLVPGDTNGVRDIFVFNFITGAVERVSVDSNGNESDAGSGFPTISVDGRFVAFQSLATNLVPRDSNGLMDIFVYDRLSRTTEIVSITTDELPSDGESFLPVISRNGDFVVFASWATNLAGGDNVDNPDIFIRDRTIGP
jgi:Tol biopolymer transport system component